MACPGPVAYDSCAITISGNDGTQSNIVVNVYTKYTRYGSVNSTNVSDYTVFQNLMIRTFGRILGAPLSATGGKAMWLYSSQERDWANTIFLPSATDIAPLTSLYKLGARLPFATPIIQFEKVDAAGKVTGYSTREYKIENTEFDKSFRIFSARWVANTDPSATYYSNTGITSRVYSGTLSRIVEVEGENKVDNPCVDNPGMPLITLTITGLKSTQDFGLSIPVSKGAPRNTMVRGSNSMGDYITTTHSAICLSSMGDGVDLFSGW